MIWLIAIVLALFLILALKNYNLAFVLFFASLPLYIIRFDFLTLPTTLLEVMLIVLVVVSFFKFKVYKKFSELKTIPFIAPLIVFFIAAVISLFVTPQFREAIGVFKAYIIEAFLVYFLLFFAFKSEEGKKYLRSMLLGLGVSLIYLSAYAIFQKITGIGLFGEWSFSEGRRVSSVLGYPNSLSLFLSPLIPVFFVLALKNKLLPRFFSWLVLALSSLAIIFTVSQGGIIAACVACFLVLFLCGYKKIVAALILITILSFIFVPYLNNNVSEIINGKDVSTDVRIQIWKGTARMIKDNPVLGVGLRGFQARYEEYKEPAHTEIVLYPHNIFMNFWTEMGLLGLFAVIWLLVAVYRRNLLDAINNKEVTAMISVAFFTAIIIHGLVDVPFFKNDLSIVFMAILALAGYKKA